MKEEFQNVEEEVEARLDAEFPRRIDLEDGGWDVEQQMESEL